MASGTRDTALYERWGWRLLFLLEMLALAALLVRVATHRVSILSDEWFYIYESWARYHGHPTGFPLLYNFGAITGLPFLFAKEPGVLTIRLYGFVLWLGAYALFFYGYLHHLGLKRSLPWLLGLVLFSMVF